MIDKILVIAVFSPEPIRLSYFISLVIIPPRS